MEKKNVNNDSILNYQIFKITLNMGHTEKVLSNPYWMKIGRCTKGNGVVIGNDKEWAYENGMYCIIHSDQSSMVKCKSKAVSTWEYIVINEEIVFRTFHQLKIYNIDTIRESSKRHPFLFHAQEMPELAHMINLVFIELQKKHFLYKESVCGLLQSIMILLLRDSSVHSVSKDIENDYELAYIIPSLKYIEDHYQESIRISFLTNMCHVSESYYRNIFLHCMKITPLEYINHIRIEKACNLIKSTKYSMEEISNRVGFQSISSFYRNFKSQMGCTPYQWKKQ